MLQTDISEGEYGDDEPQLDDGALVDSEGDHWLITDRDDLDANTVEISEIDNYPARVRYHYEDADTDGIGWTEKHFSTLRDARLVYGLRLRCGGYNEPASSDIPRVIALAGKPAIAAYLKMRGWSRERLAAEMDVSEQTISNYWSKIRWSPE
jgi:hypothetical protein